MTGRVRFLTTAMGAACALAFAPAAASAATAWVAPAATVSGPGTSCSSPGYNTIQAAAEGAASGSKINICGGTYVEQLQITKPLKIAAVGSVDVKLPATPEDSTTACDTSIGAPYEPNQDLVSICTPDNVSITGVTFEAKWPALTCDDSLYGIFVAGGATLKLADSTVDGAGNPPPDPDSGCQGGVAIQLGSARTTPNETAKATLSGDTVEDYQKNGIDVTGSGTSAKITATTVTGSGATPDTAQNGIEVAYGGSAKISGVTVSGNECENSTCGANPISDYQATGVLFYGAAAGSSLSDSKLDDNDIGVYYEDEAATAPSGSQVSIKDDRLEGDRYESVALGKGDATVDDDEIAGGTVGIALVQVSGEPYGPTGKGKEDTISGLTSYAVEGFSDHGPSDPAGSFTISGSAISGNPFGAGVTGSVYTESPNLNIYVTPTDH